MKKALKYLWLLTMLLFTQACTTTPKQDDPAPVVDRSTSARGDEAAVMLDDARLDEMSGPDIIQPQEHQQISTVVVALMENARHEVNVGKWESAAATLERALRLQPKNALLWHRLGALRLQQRNWPQAINLASKSNSLAAGNYSLQAANWQIIAQARQLVGDDEGAKKARKNAAQLKKQ